MAIYQTSERFKKIKQKVVGNSYIAGNETGEEKKPSQENKYQTSTRFRKIKQAVYQRGLSSKTNRIKQFADDVQGFAATAQKDSSTLSYSNAAELSNNYSKSGGNLRNEAISLLDYLDWSKDYMSEDAYNDTVSFIKQAKNYVGSVTGYYNNQANIVAGFKTEEDYNAAVQQVQDAISYKTRMDDTTKEEDVLAGMTPTQRMYHINSGGFVDTQTPWSEQVSYAITLLQIGADEGYALTDRLLKQLTAQQKNLEMNDLTYEKEASELRGYYNELVIAKNADILAKTKMDGTDRSVLAEMQLIAELDPGEEKDKRKDAVIKTMEALGISTDDYALYTDDGNFSWDTFGKWLSNSASAGLHSFYKGMADTANVLVGKPLQAIGWENNPISLASEHYEGLYDTHKLNQNLYAERLGGGEGWQYAGEAVEGTIGALPQMIAAIATAGTSTGSDLATKAAYEAGNWLAKAGITVETMMKNPQYWLSFARNLGTNYEEAIQMGASQPVAALGATFSSLLNAGIEIGLDGGSGIQGLPDNLLSGNKNAFWAWFASGLEEGGEEWGQKGINEIVAKVLYDHDLEFSSPLEYAREASIGTLSGLALGGGQIGLASAEKTIEEQISKNKKEQDYQAYEQMIPALMADVDIATMDMPTNPTAEDSDSSHTSPQTETASRNAQHGGISEKEYNILLRKQPIKAAKKDWAKVSNAWVQRYASVEAADIPEIDSFSIAEYNKLNVGYIYTVRNNGNGGFVIIKKAQLKPESEKVYQEEYSDYDRKNSDEDTYPGTDTQRSRKGIGISGSSQFGNGRELSGNAQRAVQSGASVQDMASDKIDPDIRTGGAGSVNSLTDQEILAQAVDSVDMDSLNPRLRQDVRDYRTHWQKLRTTQSLLQQELNKLQQLQQGNKAAWEIQRTKSKIKDLQNILTREQNTLKALSQKPTLQQRLQEARADQSAHIRMIEEARLPLEKKTNSDNIDLKRFNTTADPMREVAGAGLKSNAKEIQRFLDDLNASGVEIRYHNENMAYSPGLTPGKPGQFIIDKNASYSAWAHEYKHFCDDRDDGFPGMRIFMDTEKCKQREIDAYNVEIEMARKMNRDDIVERLEKLKEQEVSRFDKDANDY